MADLLDDYAAGPAWDEMFDRDGQVRPSYRAMHDVLRTISPADITARADALASGYTDQGVTFDIGGVERPFPLDVVPRVIASAEWESIEAGVAQRVRALEAFLADVYGPRLAIRDGVVPAHLITSCAGFHRQVVGIQPPNGVRIHVAGIDLIRDTAGIVRVLEDNVRVPSGVSYVITNRRAMANALPEGFTNQRVRPVSGYPSRLLAALRASAPPGTDDPTVVVLTPGVFNGAYFEHSLLARTMGIELVEGRDLLCRAGKVFMRTTEGLQRVDVIYRRVDDEFIDPVHFRSSSMLGVPGLVNAVRSGGVTVANAIGNGVADDKLVYTFVPELTRYYLGEEPLLPNVDSWRLEEPDAREEVMDRLEELVVKPVGGSGGKGIVIGPAASRDELVQLRDQVLADPRGWIAQPLIQLSTVPTLSDDRLEPRHVDLRPFAVNDGSSVWVLPGGLTRVALPRGEMIVNSSQGGGSKDTWVLTASKTRPVRDETAENAPEGPEGVPLSDPLANSPAAGTAAGQQEQQQQQRQQRQPQTSRRGGRRSQQRQNQQHTTTGTEMSAC